MENHLHEHDQKFDMIVKTPELPNEGVFFDGQIFDAFKLVMQLIKSAEHRIILIDNYINEEILTMFDQRANGVIASIYTARIDSAMQQWCYCQHLYGKNRQCHATCHPAA